MATQNDIKVGDELFVTSSHYRYVKEHSSVFVKGVGRKYIEVSLEREARFPLFLVNKKTLRCDDSRSKMVLFYLCRTKEELDAHIEKEKMLMVVIQKTNYGSLFRKMEFDDLKAIYDVVKKY